MIQKIKSVFGNIISGGIGGTYENENVRKAIIINLFSFLGLFSLLTFFVVGIFITHRNNTYLIVIFGFILLTISNFFLLRKTKKVYLPGNILVSMMFLMEIGLLTFLGEGLTGILWYYVFPLLALFILGKRTGTIYILLLLIFSVLLFIFPLKEMTEYPRYVQGRLLFTYIITSALAYVFEMVRHKTYDVMVEAKKKVITYLSQILQQKEEIQTQAELLEQNNHELEKLSIVASKTTNSVIIMNAFGAIDWVNDGFSNLYGNTFTEILQEGKRRFFDLHPGNKTDFEECLKNKKSIYFETSFRRADNSTSWLQVALTPIINDDDVIEKIIAVGSNINQIKEAEQEILQQSEEIASQRDALELYNQEILQKNEEILAQRDALEITTRQVERQNEYIKGGIRYALTIQSAILPLKTTIDKYYESFIIFSPKDIVSGDFYWYSHIKDSNLTFVAVVDCTGHGVPGAFMSMIGSRLLSEIVNERKIYHTNDILNFLNSGVQKVLKQEKSGNTDGMDVCLCRIEQNNDEYNVQFTGAKRPLFHYNPNNKNIEIIKGDIKTIGGRDYPDSNFTIKNLTLQKDHILYLSSDGLADQNNPDRKRFTEKRLIQELSATVQLSMEEQEKHVTTQLKKHQQNENQRDDITLLGLRFR